MSVISDDQIQQIKNGAEKHGYAIIPVIQGYLAMWKRLVLQQRLDATPGPVMAINVTKPDGSLIETLYLNKTQLQSQIDATDPSERFVLTLLLTKPIQN